jgi:hypothetical protein
MLESNMEPFIFGSGIDATGQKGAHDLLRKKSLSVLFDKTMKPGAIELVNTATTVSTMAPGEDARKACGTSTLKDKSAMGQWKQNRNEGKARVKALQLQLLPVDFTFALPHLQTLFTYLRIYVFTYLRF